MNNRKSYIQKLWASRSGKVHIREPWSTDKTNDWRLTGRYSKFFLPADDRTPDEKMNDSCMDLEATKKLLDKLEELGVDDEEYVTIMRGEVYRTPQVWVSTHLRLIHKVATAMRDDHNITLHGLKVNPVYAEFQRILPIRTESDPYYNQYAKRRHSTAL